MCRFAAAAESEGCSPTAARTHPHSDGILNQREPPPTVQSRLANENLHILTIFLFYFKLLSIRCSSCKKGSLTNSVRVSFL